ncbi:MAG TPA: hypothetical protein VGK73_40245 [Polyangiaceae bacterium]
MSARLRTAPALFAVALAVAGCASDRRPPPRAPSLPSPNDAVPLDLDLVIRVDLARVRAGLGPEAVGGLRRNALGASGADASDPWIAEAVEKSDTAILALRPEFGAEGPDNVLVLSGRFSDVLPLTHPPPGWLAPVDLGGNVRRFDRKRAGLRSTPVRFYAFGTEQLVFVSVAELDSVEAVLERGRSPTRLRPKASGLLSFQARLRDARRLLAGRFPILGKLLGGSKSVAGTLDVTGDSLVTDLGLELGDDTEASEVAAALDGLKKELAEADGRIGLVARNTKIEPAGRFVGVRMTLGRDALSGLWR